MTIALKLLLVSIQLGARPTAFTLLKPVGCRTGYFRLQSFLCRSIFGRLELKRRRIFSKVIMCLYGVLRIPSSSTTVHFSLVNLAVEGKVWWVGCLGS
jgi:hypothetical protein